MATNSFPPPVIMPLGDTALLVRFSETLEDEANERALNFAAAVAAEPVAGVVEIVPSLVSVLLRYDPLATDPIRLAGELALRVDVAVEGRSSCTHEIEVTFGQADGPDLEEVARMLELSPDQFIQRHNATTLRVLTTGFAPGFVYCGFHDEGMVLPRRTQVRPLVPAGSILFAAGQTAIAATDIPTGWHVIGRTGFRNFDPTREPSTLLAVGDRVVFRAEQ